MYSAPVEDWLFQIWWRWLAVIFRFDTTTEQRDAYLASLRQHNFTNKDVIYAGRWLEQHYHHFPFLAGWLQCPEIPRNVDNPAFEASGYRTKPRRN